MLLVLRCLRLLMALAAAVAALPLAAQTDPIANDKVGSFDWVRPHADFVRREAMVRMRDGRHLYTVIVFRKGVRDAPILLSRTPYNAAATTARIRSQKIEDILPLADGDFVADGYIRVYQDVRGMDRSEGEYVVTRPLRGPLNPTRVDHATDAWDTIDWLVHNVPESNGRVGVIGASYLGFTALMATIDPHPALKAAVPQSPMVDGWMGDDWFHNGAFRPPAFDFLLAQTVARGGGPVPMGEGDAYDAYLSAGSVADFVALWGLDRLPAVRKLLEHPAYDDFWQEQALDRLLAKRGPRVPMLIVASQWDQEDAYGGPAVYRALEVLDRDNDMIFLGLGPWRHSQVNFDGSSLGPLVYPLDTAQDFRRRWMKPFLDCRLKSDPPPCATPPVVTWATGANRWEEAPSWPQAAERPLYLSPGGGLSFTRPGAADAVSWRSDPANPVPMMPRPVRLEEDGWRTWMVMDQRFLAGRADVVSWITPPLDRAVQIRGAPRVELYAATSARDADWVVKLIDVHPDEGAAPGMAGYHLPVGMEIFRGRYVHGFATPAPLEPGKTYRFEWRLPDVNHVFRPGHRIMVQVQSSLFPIYDRNPQGWVPSIFHARPQDYVAATHSVAVGGDAASAVWLPVVGE